MEIIEFSAYSRLLQCLPVEIPILSYESLCTGTTIIINNYNRVQLVITIYLTDLNNKSRVVCNIHIPVYKRVFNYLI